MKEQKEKKYWEELEHKKKRPVTHPVVTFYSKQRIEYMRRNLSDFNNVKTVLDVGAGYGYSSYHLPSSMNVLALDFSLMNLIANPVKNKIQASALDLPFRSNSFDLVLGWSFLHHLDDPEKAVIEMARVTKKYLVLLEPNRNNPVQFAFGLLHPMEHGTLKFTKQKLLGYLEKIKFKLISCEATGWLFNGASPVFSLKIAKHLPFVHKLGLVNIMICEKTHE